MQNNYESQTYFSKAQIYEKFVGFSKEEAMVGQFCSKIFKNNENYLIAHLNRLIHGISCAIKNFEHLPRLQKNKNKEVGNKI